MGLAKAGKKQADIAATMKVSRKTVWRIIKRFNETNTTNARPRSGRPRTVNTPALRAKIRSRIRYNNQRSMNKMAKELNVNPRTVRLIVRNELGLFPYKLLKAQTLADRHKIARLQKCEAMLRRFRNNKHRRILFTDEKVFSVEQYHNHHNDRELLPKGSYKDPNRTRVTRSQGPANVMVWAGVCATGKTPLVFVEKGVKVNSTVYQKMLNDEVVPWANDHFGNRPWTFQQDGASAYTSRSTQGFLRDTFPDIIAKTEWPANSPDLNPCDYSIWGILETKLNGKKFRSVQALKNALIKA